jgi:PAS domain S-box-containing protein
VEQEDDTALSEQSADGLTADAIVDALPRAIVVTSPDGRILLWNRQAEALYGWPADEVTGRMASDVLVPIDGRDHAGEILDVVGAGDAWAGDFTLLRRDGSPVRIWVSNRPIIDDSGHLLAIVGASEDVAEQRLLEQRAVDLSDRLRLALDAGELGTFRWDMATGVTEWDAKLEALFGLESGGFDGTFEGYVKLLHPDDRDEVLRTVNNAVAERSRYTIEHKVLWPDGTTHWLEGSGQVTVDADGAVTGTIGCTRDVTEQVLAERERQRLTLEAVDAAENERVHRERLEFLGRINDAVTSAHNRHELMVNVAAAAVPRLGEWCSIFVLPHDQARVPEVEIAHADPAKAAYARELQERFPYDPDATVGMPHVIRTGAVEFYPTIDDSVLDDLNTTDEARDVVRDLMLGSSISVPLIKRGRILGGLQLIMSKASRRYTNDDLLLAEAVAARIAASLDNLRLSDAQRSIASTLQASLLPDQLPDIAGVDVAVRYWANGEGVEVGGDFYDLFGVADGTWAVVIGDVCGTGTAAAAITGLARHTIASAAWHGDDHKTVLDNLNLAMRHRDAERFCTAVYGTIEPAPSGDTTFTFACAGHPLPIVARADGTVASDGAYGSIIGVFDDIQTTTTTTTLHPGDVVVLYTDGVTDVSAPYALDDEEFGALVGTAVVQTSTAEQLADRLHAELSSILPINKRHDDIALLILRVPNVPH